MRNGNTNVEKIFRNINLYKGHDAKITAQQNYCSLLNATNGILKNLPKTNASLNIAT